MKVTANRIGHVGCAFATACLFAFTAQAKSLAQVPEHAAVASAHPQATAAGLKILRAGGNAFDAAVAVAAALAVVEPNSSGLGGGGFWLLHRAADNTDTMVDAREVAPLAANRDMFLDAQGVPVPGLSRDTALAAGIPGAVAGMAYVAARYGKLPLRESLQPAIHLAAHGFPLYERLRANIEFAQDTLQHSNVAAHIFLRNGKVPPLGTQIRQPLLAKTLRLIAAHGAQEFYEGEFATQLVHDVRQLGGIWTEDDLAQYRVQERVPVCGEYHGARITSAAPPSSGGVTLINALNILSGYSLATLDEATRKHLIIEAMRRAYRDRAEYLGDPDFVSIPITQLLHPFYAAGQRTAIRLDRATLSVALPGVANNVPESSQTTHFAVLDTEGNRVATTVTINFGFGSGLMAPNAGFFLNNEMDDFSIKPGVPNGFQLVGAEANAIAPGKRMLSSMAPTFVETEQGLLIIGTPGGSRIISMVLLGTLEWLAGHSAAEVVALPRFHHQYLPDVVMFENGALTPAVKQALELRGHVLQQQPKPYGNMQVITWDYASGKVNVAHDPRGQSAGWQY